MHDHTIEGLVEDVRHTRAHVREKTHGITDEVGGTKDAIQLSQHLLAIVIHDTFLQIRQRQAHVSDRERVHFQWCSIDVSEGHCDSVQDYGERVPQAEPEGKMSEIRVAATDHTYCSSLLTRSVRMKEIASLTGCRSRTSKYKFSPTEVESGSGISSGPDMRTLEKCQKVITSSDQ